MTEKITINEFKKLIPTIKCKHILTELSNKKIKEICDFSLKEITKIDDIKKLGKCKVVWYKDSRKNCVGWDTPKAINLNVEEESLIYQYKYKLNGVGDLLNKIKKGLNADIKIIIVHDISSNTKMVVEGVHRSFVLYHLYLYRKKLLTGLLKSKYSIKIITIKTKVGSQLFPYDFINIYRLNQ